MAAKQQVAGNLDLTWFGGLRRLVFVFFISPFHHLCLPSLPFISSPAYAVASGRRATRQARGRQTQADTVLLHAALAKGGERGEGRSRWPQVWWPGRFARFQNTVDSGRPTTAIPSTRRCQMGGLSDFLSLFFRVSSVFSFCPLHLPFTDQLPNRAW